MGLTRSGVARARQAAMYAAAALPVIGIALYLAVGSPQLASRPYATRLDTPTDQATAADLVARVEAHLRANPEDGRGWDVLAPVYLRMGDYTQAADAFQKAARLLGESPRRLGGYARALIMLQNGVVNEPARQAYSRLLSLEPQSLEPKVWLAIAREQDGDLKGAQSEYRTLLVGAEEPWKGLLEARLQAVTERLGGPAAPLQNAPKDLPPPLPPQAIRRRCPRPIATSSSTRWSRGSPRASRRTARISKAGCACCAPTWCSAAATRPSPRFPARAVNSRATRNRWPS